MSNPKTTLYKYVGISRLKDILQNSRLYLSDGTNFNDPFELKVIDKKTGEINHINGLHILCLTNSYRKKLMWSHYADSHKGVCLTVEIPSHLVYSVCYTSERIFTNSNIDKIIDKAYKGNKKNLVKSYECLSENQKIAFIKDSKWNYEKEYRVVFNSEEGVDVDKENNKYYMSVKIKNIYLGINFDIKENQDIIDICKEKKISIKRMKLSDKNYSLSQEDYKKQ